jgi:hypothetical protein
MTSNSAPSRSACHGDLIQHVRNGGVREAVDHEREPAHGHEKPADDDLGWGGVEHEQRAPQPLVRKAVLRPARRALRRMRHRRHIVTVAHVRTKRVPTAGVPLSTLIVRMVFAPLTDEPMISA